jgi:intracellular sulfur oxidation DsrE/DsrF family protein
MNTNETKGGTDRRSFLGTLATGAAAVGLTTMAPSLNAFAGTTNFDPKVSGDPEAMFKKINGKHRAVFDVPGPNGLMPFAWPKIFLLTNAATGTPEKENSVIVVLRHDGIPYAFNDSMWKKYKFSEFFKKSGELGAGFQAADAATAATMRNPLWNPKSGDFKVPGIGPVPIGINELQASGVQFCVCNMAMTVYSAVVAMQTNGKAPDILKEWTDNLLPGIQVVPSGVWALGRAQENKCSYISTVTVE